MNSVLTDEQLRIIDLLFAEELEFLASLTVGRSELDAYRPVVRRIGVGSIWAVRPLKGRKSSGREGSDELYCGDRTRAMRIFVRTALELGLLSGKALTAVMIDGGMALPLIKKLEYVNNLHELQKVSDFYSRPFRLGLVRKLYHFGYKKRDSTHSLCFGPKMITISRSEQFIVTDRELSGDEPMFEYVLPYPERLGDFIDSSTGCGITLRLKRATPIC